MNTLSWALYAAGAFNSLKPLLAIAGVALGPGAYLAVGFQRMDEPVSARWPWPSKSWAAASVFLLLLACAVPSAKTVYLIAASEAGERVATSPEGRDMLELVRRRLRELLSDKA